MVMERAPMSITLTPSEAVNGFLEERKGEVAHSTWRNYRYPLKDFIKFCDDKNIEHVNDLTGYHLKQFKIRRRNTEGVGAVTVKNNLSVIRVFLKWCGEAELVEREFYKLVQLPELDDGEIVSDEAPALDFVEDILDYLYKFEYATRKHAIFQLMWHTTMRMGAVQALDLSDYHPRKQQLSIRHRPDKGTTLKNENGGERDVNLNDAMCTVLDDYIDAKRHPVTDEYGREPLFTTPSKRIYDSILRKDMYGLTRPCFVGLDCPHERDPETCDATKKNEASKCPSSLSPHPLRRAAITYHLNQEWPKERLSERADVSVSVLDKHYDARTKQEEAATRKQYLDNL